MTNEHKSFFQKIFAGSKKLQYLFIGLLSFIVALLILQAGISIGYHKAVFSEHNGQRYANLVEGPGRGGMMNLPIDLDMSANHGAFGKIVSITFPSFVVASPDNREKTVILDDDTAIRIFRNTASTSDMKINQMVAVLGEPDDMGNIEAKLIRIMPDLPTTTAPVK